MMGGGGFAGGGGLFGGGCGSSLFGAPKPAVGAAAGTAPPPGQPMSVAQWLAHAHTDLPSQALVHQHRRLQRFLSVPGFPPESSRYVRTRVADLASGHCVAAYQWDGGGTGWESVLPTDSEVLIHILTVFLDLILPPPVAAAAAAPAAAAGGLGGSLGRPAGGLGRRLRRRLRWRRLRRWRLRRRRRALRGAWWSGCRRSFACKPEGWRLLETGRGAHRVLCIPLCALG